MKFIELRRLCNARFYSLEVYGLEDSRKSVEIDVEDAADKMALADYDETEVLRIQPYVTDDDEPGLEVELNV